MSDIIIPDAIEPVVAYKALVVLPGYRLRSPSKYFEWPKREKAVARCFRQNHPGHEMVGQLCRCGIYALDITQRHRLLGYFGHRHVIVRLALWGRTAIGTTGWRAEFAYPQEIVAWTCTNYAARKVAEDYGLGIVMDNPRKHWCIHPKEEMAE